VEFFVDPRRLADGGVHQGVAEGLGPGGLLLGIARFPVLVVLHVAEGFLLGGSQIGHILGLGLHQGHIEVDGFALGRIDGADGGGHTCAPVAALGDKVIVAKPCHQLNPGLGRAVDAPAGAGRLAGKAKARQRRDHQMKGVFGIAAVGSGVGERADNVHELDHRTGPAVGHDHRQGVGVGRANMQEVNFQPVDFRFELAKAVQLFFAAAPVIVVEPVVTQAFYGGQRRALGPVGDGLLLGPAGVG